MNLDTIHECMIVKHFYRKFLLTVTLTLCKLCINYSPVQSFSIRLGLFSLKNWDRTVLRSSPKNFGDCTAVRSNFFRRDRSAVQSQFFWRPWLSPVPNFGTRPLTNQSGPVRSAVSRSGPASLDIMDQHEKDKVRSDDPLEFI